MSWPITQTDSYDTYDGLQQTGVTTTYNSYGEVTGVKSYDFGAGAVSTTNSRGAVLSVETLGYGGSTAPANFLSSDVIAAPSGALESSVSYGYDQTTPSTSSGVPSHISVSGARGNLTSVATGTGSTTYTTTYTYEDTGSLLSSVDPSTSSGAKTVFNYDANFVYNTGVQLPTPSSGVALSSSQGYDQANTGLPETSTDSNSQTTTIKSYDELLRPTLINYPDGGITTIIYRNPNQTGVFRSQSSAQTAETETRLDAYGRQSRVAVAQNAAATIWYQQDTCYDANGRVSFQSYPYQNSGFGVPKVCGGSGTGDTYTYDALGRVIALTHGDGTLVTYQYTGRATKVKDENGVTRISQVDGLGRTTIACEISSNTLQGDSPGSCSTDIAGTGFVTSYGYDLANHKTTVTQGVQTRVFQTDGIGRPIYTSEPERGVTTYAYSSNTTGWVVTRTRPRANQASTSVTTTTTKQYDNQSRPVSITYSDGTPTKTFNYDSGAGWGQAQSNLKGRLSRAIVPALGNDEASIFSYDQMGRVLFTGQCFAYGCGNGSKDKYIGDTYDQTGNLLIQYDPTAGVIAYTYNAASQLTSATNQTYTDSTNPPSLISNVNMGPDGPISYQQGNGLGNYWTYNGRGQNTGKWLCQGASPSYHCATNSEPQVYGTELAWVGNKVSADCDTVMGSCRNFGYDEFARLNSQTVNSQTTYTNVYDRYGNRWQQNALQGGPSSSVAFNKATNQVTTSSYDAVGNVTSDGVHTYTYDAEGNVTQVDRGNTANYTYDALNHRVRVQTASQTSDYTFDAIGRRITEWQESNDFGIEGSEYWGSSSERIAYRNGPTVFEEQDWMGTERVRTNASGSLQSSYFSLPFGDGFSASGSDADPAHFAEQDHDAESATDHAQFRQYSATLGRWMSPDPYDGSYDSFNPQSFNRYSYVLNNALSFIDPLGLEDCDGDCIMDPVFGGGTTVYGTPPPDPDPCDSLDCFGSGGGSGINSGAGSGGGSGGGSKPTPPTAPSKTGCPAVPTAPPGAKVNQNMAKAKIQGIFNPLAPLWFYNQVNYGGAMDYKTQGAQYEDFGNFNYGATGTAAYAPSFTLLRAAGWAQRGHPSSPQFGGNPGSLPGMVLNPFGGTAPYGDDPHDQQMIQQGIQYARNGCGG